MNHTASPLLRRLDRRRRSSLDRADNPFEWARKARAARVLTVGLHSSLATGLTEAQARLIRSLQTPLGHKAIEVVRTSDPDAAWMPSSSVFTVVAEGSDFRLTMAAPGARDHERQVLFAPRHASGWTHVDGASPSLDAEVDAFAILDVDLIVTVDGGLLGSRESPKLTALNLMTPEEAMVVIGVWSRTIHEAFIPHAKVNNGLYHWAAARAVVPAAWPTVCAFVYGRYDLPDGVELDDLAGSILDHVKTLLRGLDRLLAVWHCATNNDTNDELQIEFVQLVIAAWSVHDNLALLAGRYLAIDLRPKHSSSWELGHPKWMASMRQRGRVDKRARAMTNLVTRAAPYVNALRALRNDFAHRARDRMRTVAGHDEPKSARLVIGGDLLLPVRGQLDATRETAEAWGFGPVEKARTVEVHDISTGETHSVDEGPQCDLDVVPFAARLAAYVAWLANETMRILDPASDERIPYRERCRGERADEWATPSAAAHVIGTSGVAGLVDWADVAEDRLRGDLVGGEVDGDGSTGDQMVRRRSLLRG